MQTIEQKFRKLSDIEHVLLRPGRYIGQVTPHTALTWVVDQSANKMVKSEITWNPGLIKLFDEVISNSVDHSKRPEGKHLDTIKVDIDRTNGTISVFDNGGIPVEFHKIEEEYVPSMIFGSLRAGSNFDDSQESDGTGQNGEGASLTNIFSTEFIVETSDGKKKFRQVWSKNMTERSEPSISNGSKGFTQVTYTPDYQRLGMNLDDGNYAKIIKRVYDVAGCNKHLKIYLNGERIKIGSFKDYIGFYTDSFEFDDNGDWQVGIAASDDGFGHVSFVNTTETSEGGSHVYHVWHQIATKLREFIKKKHKIDVKQSEIQSHMQVFINARIINPRYNSQTKDFLITESKDYKTTWEVSDKFIKRVVESGIVDRVLTWAEAKAKAEELKKLRELSKDIDKGNPRRVEKFSDAMEDNDRHLCELYLTEGDSARLAIHSGRGKNPYIGSFPLKGKPLNVRDCDLKKILGGKKDGKEDEGNAEIKNILKITGLKIGEKVEVEPDGEWIEVEIDNKIQILNVNDVIFFENRWQAVKDLI